MLERSLRDPSPAVRRRAALAIGRLQDSTRVPQLVAALADADAGVRHEAIFALGQTGHRSARPALEGAFAGRDADAQALAIEALGKLADPAATPAVVRALGSGSARLRGEAAVALWRLADTTALGALLARHDDPDPEVRWRVLYALEKLVVPDRVVPVVSRRVGDGPWLVRAYAARTLGRQKSRTAIPALLRALDDAEVGVVVNAIRAIQLIADSSDAALAPRLVAKLRHPHAYVRQTAAVALGDRFAWAPLAEAPRAALADSLARATGDPDPATRGAAGRALLVRTGDSGADRARGLWGDPSPYVRVAMLNALRDAPAGRDWSDFIADRAKRGKHVLERATAAEVLGARHERGAAALLRAGLADTAVLYVASCAAGLAELRDTASVPALLAAYAARAADADADARISIRDALRDLAGTAVADSVEHAHPATNAAAEYGADFADEPRETGAVLHTARGDVEWAFYAAEAPQTVKNFVRLARRGYFDGTVFHRVVPNFVIQDGDPTGTGSGGPGYTIRCEYNALHYVPGQVGMALSGKDTGGSQWFITHSPQLHLDGRYTIFARVVRGMDVVHRLTQGDAIEKVEILGPKR